MKLPRFEPNRLQINKRRYHCAFVGFVMGWSSRWDLTGNRFGRLVVVERAESLKGFAAWICQCDCGALKVVRGTALRAGKVVSCGCYHRDKHTKHGRRASQNKKTDPTYTSYISMKSRVLNPESTGYHNYGGRGIKICPEWIEGGFKQFLHDMGERPPGTSLDRIDVDGDYCPSNCKWSTPKEQANNRRSRTTSP